MVEKIAVIGLGRFGMELARQLSGETTDVIAIDRSSSLIQEIKDDVEVAVRLDSTDRDALLSQEIDKVDVCAICIGENFEAALLTTVIVKKFGVPRILCRAQSQFHAEIFLQIGADEVIQPELEAGKNLARRLLAPQLELFIPLDEGNTLIELHAPGEFQGKSVVELGLRKVYRVNLVAIKRPEEVEEEGGGRTKTYRVRNVPSPDEVILSGDLLVLVGSNDSLAKLPRE